MFSKEQFLKYRDTHYKWYDWSYEQYLHWAYQKQTHKRNIKLLIISHSILLIIGILLGVSLS